MTDPISLHESAKSDEAVEPASRGHFPAAFPILLIVASLLGWFAAFKLLLEKLQSLENPQQALSCDINPFIQCTLNLNSPQGAVLGFPNPIIGLAAWIAPLILAIALFAGAHFARWFWVTFNLGVLGGWLFTCWLQYQSIFVLGTLCPWCALTWAAMIPVFWLTLFYSLSIGVWSQNFHIRRIGAQLFYWAPIVVLVNYLVIAISAQSRIDLIGFFLG